MGDGEVRKPTVFGDDLGETWNKAVGNGGEERDTIPLSSGRAEENKRLSELPSGNVEGMVMLSELEFKEER